MTTRLSGFLLGVVVAIALIVGVLHHGVTVPPSDDAVQPVPEGGGESAADPVAPVAHYLVATTTDDGVLPGDVDPMPAPPVESVAPTEPAPMAVTDESVADAASTDAEASAMYEPPGDGPVELPVPGDGQLALDEGNRQWFPFWQPFRSRISAEGFVSRLEGVTGLDYRVVGSGAGDYRVAFGYADEAERQRNLAAIEAATGLVLRNHVL